MSGGDVGGDGNNVDCDDSDGYGDDQNDGDDNDD